MLGVDASAAAAAVKKQFWRTSLLVHPDKCAHERAGDAFDAVKKAAQVLQDAAARGAVDAGRAAVDDEELNRKVMAELEQERKWRILQGRATAQDLECATCQPCLKAIMQSSGQTFGTAYIYSAARRHLMPWLCESAVDTSVVLAGARSSPRAQPCGTVG